MMKQLYLAGVFLLVFSSTAIQAQYENDTITKKDKKEKPVLLEPYYRNVIKFNPTPMLLWDLSNITFSYERLIKKDQSISLQAGYLLFPHLLNDTVLNLIEIYERDRKGMNLALDYRYYPLSRNRRPAPDGLYIGGYLSHYNLTFNNKFNVLYTTIDQQGAIDGKINITNLGIELGYQFIFWKRFSLDLLMFGPSFSMVNTSVNISGELDEEQIENIDQELIDNLLDRHPQLGSVFSDDGLEYSGRKTKFSTLFRYSIQLGVHF